MKNNTYFENFEKIARAHAEKRKAHEDLKQGIIDNYGWDSEELKDWYNKRDAIKAEDPYGQGAYKAYRTWKYNTTDELEFSEYCWEGEFHDFIDTLRQAGIQSFVMTDHSTALMENIHGFIAEGCKLEGACILTKKTFRWGTDDEEQVAGLRFAL